MTPFDNPKGVPKVTSETQGEEITPENPEFVQQFPVDDTDEAHEAAEVEVPEEVEVEIPEADVPDAKPAKTARDFLRAEKKAAKTEAKEDIKEVKDELALTLDDIRAQRTIQKE